MRGRLASTPPAPPAPPTALPRGLRASRAHGPAPLPPPSSATQVILPASSAARKGTPKRAHDPEALAAWASSALICLPGSSLAALEEPEWAPVLPSLTLPSLHCPPYTALPALPALHCPPCTARPALPALHCPPCTARPALPPYACAKRNGSQRCAALGCAAPGGVRRCACCLPPSRRRALRLAPEGWRRRRRWELFAGFVQEQGLEVDVCLGDVALGQQLVQASREVVAAHLGPRCQGHEGHQGQGRDEPPAAGSGAAAGAGPGDGAQPGQPAAPGAAAPPGTAAAPAGTEHRRFMEEGVVLVPDGGSPPRPAGRPPAAPASAQAASAAQGSSGSEQRQPFPQRLFSSFLRNQRSGTGAAEAPEAAAAAGVLGQAQEPGPGSSRLSPPLSGEFASTRGSDLQPSTLAALDCGGPGRQQHLHELLLRDGQPGGWRCRWRAQVAGAGSGGIARRLQAHASPASAALGRRWWPALRLVLPSASWGRCAALQAGQPRLVSPGSRRRCRWPACTRGR
jgi:hypothetical protein